MKSDWLKLPLSEYCRSDTLLFFERFVFIHKPFFFLKSFLRKIKCHFMWREVWCILLYHFCKPAVLCACKESGNISQSILIHTNYAQKNTRFVIFLWKSSKRNVISKSRTFDKVRGYERKRGQGKQYVGGGVGGGVFAKKNYGHHFLSTSSFFCLLTPHPQVLYKTEVAFIIWHIVTNIVLVSRWLWSTQVSLLYGLIYHYRRLY